MAVPLASIQFAVAQALQHHQNGKLDDAEAIYRQILTLQPEHFDALQLLGALNLGRGDSRSAVELLQRAVSLNPNYAKAWVNLGIAMRAQGRPLDSLTSFEKAITLRPNYPEALSGRGDALADLGRYAAALRVFDVVLARTPNFVAAQAGRVLALARSGEYDRALSAVKAALKRGMDKALAQYLSGEVLTLAARVSEALDCYSRALELNRRYPEALCGMGTALAMMKRNEEAVDHYDQALVLRPNYLEALWRRAAVFSVLRRFKEALRGFDEALKIAPNCSEALYNRAVSLIEQRRYVEAVIDLQSALATAVEKADFYNLCGFAAGRSGQYEQAVQFLDQALKLKPTLLGALAYKAEALRFLGKYDEVLKFADDALEKSSHALGLLDTFVYAKLFACDWRDLKKWEQRVAVELDHRADAVTPMLLMSMGDNAEQQLKCAQAFMGRLGLQDTPALPRSRRSVRPKIRIAYLSANFNQHPVGFSVVDLVEKHDRSKFDIVGVSFGTDDASTISRRLSAAFDEFYDVQGIADIDAARRMAEWDIDIAIDLMGLTADSRTGILAYRAAPIQVNYLGYPGTMGAPFIDYLVADSFVISPDSRKHIQECVVYLPQCYLPGDFSRAVPVPNATRRQQRLPDEGFVFCCFNTHYKITQTVFTVWMRLLREVDGSVLWLQGANRYAERNLRNEATALGIDPDRLIFADRVDDVRDHHARQQLADLFLDTYPYNAHSTARDALWVGLPMVSCTGTTFASRVAGSLLHSAGLDELIAHNLDEYFRIALNLAISPDALRAVRAKLATSRQTAPVFDTRQLCRELEAAYERMWEAHESGRLPTDIDLRAS